MKYLAVFAILISSPALADATTMPSLPPMPPSSPAGDEKIISGANDPVAQTCETNQRAMWKRLNMRPVKIVITTSAQWGTVWRADAAFPVDSESERPNFFRTVCSDKIVVEEPVGEFGVPLLK